MATPAPVKKEEAVPMIEPVVPKKAVEVKKVEAVKVVEPKKVVIEAVKDRVLASPLAKMLAVQKGIDLNLVKGTGPKGRIVEADINNYKEVVVAAPEVAKEVKPMAPAPVPAPVGSAFVDIPLSSIRKVIAGRLAESKATIPHYYMTQEIDVTRVLKLREVLNKDSNGTFKLSINDFVIKASSLALLDVPAVNSSWNGTFIRQYQNADIAIAVATDSGLITPIIPAAQTKGLAVISNNIKGLAERARAGKLLPHEYQVKIQLIQGGTFTISNLGMYGISHFTAIINPPHSAILAVGGVSDKLVLDPSSEKGFKATKVMTVTLSPDHRVIDGAVAATWIQKFKGYLENPLSMLL